jgi:trehalose 6-phosphate phosphatase
MRAASTLPHALAHVSALAKLPSPAPRLLFFLDYDGTLSPIVSDPDAAFITDETRAALALLARSHTTAIVSGRSLDKVRKLVALEDLIYAGSHGFDIDGGSGPGAGPVLRRTIGEEWKPVLAAAASALAASVLPVYPGTAVEDNNYALSVHYRNIVAHAAVPSLQLAVDAVAAQFGLRMTHGKCVFELRPTLEWHKGKAVEYLLDALALADGAPVLPIYIGDDVTDEDAFRALRTRGGVSVIVADSHQAVGRPTAADCRLEDTLEVRSFLAHFASLPCAAPDALTDNSVSSDSLSTDDGDMASPPDGVHPMAHNHVAPKPVFHPAPT